MWRRIIIGPKKNEKTLDPEVPYLSAIGTLIYLANNMRPDIDFSVNIWVRYSSDPTRGYLNRIKHVLRYLCGMRDMRLFYRKDTKSKLVGYADAGYLSDLHKARSQSGYVFTYGDTTISWWSARQTLTTTSSNHTELITLYNTGWEYVWLRSMIQHIEEKYGLESVRENLTVIYEDNASCIAQIKEWYIKGDITKYISSKFFSRHDLQKNDLINICQIKSSDNLADLFTKSLPRNVFEQISDKIDIRRLKDVH
jgi:hypothetical protein